MTPQEHPPSETRRPPCPSGTVRKRPRPEAARPAAPLKPSNAAPRLLLRALTYLAYDRVSVTGGRKELARVGKAVVELLVDERYPPPPRAHMTFTRKCLEFLAAPAASSLVWFVLRAACRRARARTPAINTPPAPAAGFLVASALGTVAHRVGRQALIYRLFFRIGSLQYSLASALGIVCCFFKESLWPDLVWLRRWPRHFSGEQGVAAIFRSLVYALAFSLPLQRLSAALRGSPRRRGNVKKIIFAIALSCSQRVLEMAGRVAAIQAWDV